MVISPQFDEAIEFSEGLARVKIDGKYGFIDKKGIVRINPRFNSATPFRVGWHLHGYTTTRDTSTGLVSLFVGGRLTDETLRSHNCLAAHYN
jgi:WG containing repeat